MRIITRFILASFLRPFLTAFGVLMFILILMMLAQYQNIIFGKGLTALTILKIIGYASVKMVVAALPVSVLVSSLFTMGTFGEKYELAAMRASGISINKILRPMIFSVLVISAGSFYLNSFVVPIANLKFFSLIYDIKQLKPAFSLEPGYFNNSINNYTIRIEDKNIEKEIFYDVMIYDHSNDRKDERMIVADSGYIKVDPYGKYMKMWLFSGASYETIREKEKRLNDDPPPEGFIRFYYDTLYLNFDLEGFALERTEEERFASHHYMLDIIELAESMDSVSSRKDTVLGILQERVDTEAAFDTLIMSADRFELPPDEDTDFMTGFGRRRRKQIYSTAIARARNIQGLSRSAQTVIDDDQRDRREFEIEFHTRFSLPVACLVYLFIGAPLGAVTRKGGVGMPILFAIIFYIGFSVLMIQGKKIALEEVVDVWFGVWLPVLVLVPIALPLTLQALLARQISFSEIWYQLRNGLQDALVVVLRPIVRFLRRLRR